MMRIDAVLHPVELPALDLTDLRGTVCVVFDVLRATSTIVTALAHGVKGVYPAGSIEEAHALKQRFPEALLGGERQGRRIKGFDLGNSPLEYLDLEEKEIITTTTNGTVALRACRHAAEVYAGALLNIDHLAEVLRRRRPDDLLLVCAGSGQGFSLEDAIGAGALVDRLQEVGPLLGDAARAAHSLYAGHRRALEETFRLTLNGQALERIGKSADIAWCARLSCYQGAPHMGKEDGVICIRGAGVSETPR